MKEKNEGEVSTTKNAEEYLGHSVIKEPSLLRRVVPRRKTTKGQSVKKWSQSLVVIGSRSLESKRCGNEEFLNNNMGSILKTFTHPLPERISSCMFPCIPFSILATTLHPPSYALPYCTC